VSGGHVRNADCSKVYSFQGDFIYSFKTIIATLWRVRFVQTMLLKFVAASIKIQRVPIQRTVMAIKFFYSENHKKRNNTLGWWIIVSCNIAAYGKYNNNCALNSELALVFRSETTWPILPTLCHCIIYVTAAEPSLHLMTSSL